MIRFSSLVMSLTMLVLGTTAGSVISAKADEPQTPRELRQEHRQERREMRREHRQERRAARR